MQSKVVAAEMAAAAGIPTVIAAGSGEGVLGPIVAGEGRGTRFAPRDQTPSAFKLWLRFAKPAAGRLHVDEGARRAVAEQGATLLAVGVASAEGRFDAGDAVELVGPDGVPFAKGLAEVSGADLSGRPRGVEAVHRDRLVLY
jgi:glutamate 5-kinase